MTENQSIIINSPYEEPTQHWQTYEHEKAELVPERRRAIYFRPGKTDKTNETTEELELVNRIRTLVKQWRQEAQKGNGGVSRTTMDLLNYWRNEGRQHRLFFAQLEAAETIIFLTEARDDYLHGINIPNDEPTRAGYNAFLRRCCKLATGGGKTTVMGMLAAWSILNKINNRADKRYSDAVLIVCPNVTIRERLGELNPQRGEASIYRTRDLVPPNMMNSLAQGKVLTINWHALEPQSAATARVVKSGRRVIVQETIKIGKQTQTVRGKSYMTKKDLHQKANLNLLTIIPNSEKYNSDGELLSVLAESAKYIETDAAVVRRVLYREFGNKQNILVLNDEAHHAYRLQKDETDADDDMIGDKDVADAYYREATVWMDGLDKIHKLRNINRCLDFSATPYFLGRAGGKSGQIFPWVVSDFALSDAIESGLVKIPQFSVRTSDGKNSYYDLWNWIRNKLTPAERGGKKTQPRPEAILKYAHTPIALMAGDYEETRRAWQEDQTEQRPPVFIIVCKNVKLAKMVYEWLAENKNPLNIPPSDIESLQNTADKINTIRIDSKVSQEIESGNAKNLETQWMRFMLDTIGKTDWTKDEQNRPLYPPEFEELAKKLNRPTTPPGRDIRCIVSVSMLTEGWDCSTVTHIIGLRPFMSQLLCEQVVGRGLRRANYAADENDRLSEELATVFGVPFRSVPIKNETQNLKPHYRPHHIYAVPDKQCYALNFPRVERYRHDIRRQLTVDFSSISPLNINDSKIPPEVQTKGALMNVDIPSLHGPGIINTIELNNFRETRLQERQFKMAEAMVKKLTKDDNCDIPAPILFSQIFAIVVRYFAEKISAKSPYIIKDAFLSPYYGFIMETLCEAIRPDTTDGETPEMPVYEINRAAGHTAEVDFFTRYKPTPVNKSHLNAVVAVNQLEEQTVYVLDTNEFVHSFVKNEQLGFAIPYFLDGEMHEYRPDFIVRLQNNAQLILEPKGYDPKKYIKQNAANRWINAVNADGKYGRWHYAMIEKSEDINAKIQNIVNSI